MVPKYIFGKSLILPQKVSQVHIMGNYAFWRESMYLSYNFKNVCVM